MNSFIISTMKKPLLVGFINRIYKFINLLNRLIDFIINLDNPFINSIIKINFIYVLFYGVFNEVCVIDKIIDIPFRFIHYYLIKLNIVYEFIIINFIIIICTLITNNTQC